MSSTLRDQRRVHNSSLREMSTQRGGPLDIRLGRGDKTQDTFYSNHKATPKDNMGVGRDSLDKRRADPNQQALDKDAKTSYYDIASGANAQGMNAVQDLIQPGAIPGRPDFSFGPPQLGNSNTNMKWGMSYPPPPVLSGGSTSGYFDPTLGSRPSQIDLGAPSFLPKDARRKSSLVGIFEPIRPRGDSFVLRPPVNSYGYPRLSSSELDPFTQYPNSDTRSNSLFNSLLQLPGSNRNSLSGSSHSVSSIKRNSTHNGASSMNNAPNPRTGRSSNSVMSLQEFEDGLGTFLSGQQQYQPQNRSLADMKALQEQLSRYQTQNNFKNSQSWADIYNFVEQGGSLNGNSIPDIVAGLSNSGLNWGFLNEQQKKESISKFVNETQGYQRNEGVTNTNCQSPSATELKEDMFKNSSERRVLEKEARDNNSEKNPPPFFDSRRLDSATNTNDILLKQPYEYNDIPQSPKTTPKMYNPTLVLEETYQPSQDLGYDDSDKVVNYGAGYMSPHPTKPEQKNIRKENEIRNHYSKDNKEVPAENIPINDYGRPLLGATKIDQLMLVIQARDKGVKSPIEMKGGKIPSSTNPSHKEEILPLPQTLVGSVDKPKKLKLDSLPQDSRDNKKRECSYCHKTFTQTTHLEVHMRSHIGYKPFECSFCHKKFTQGGNLRTHLRLHTGERPFSCDICKKSFNRKGNLVAHKLTHENLRPYKCILDNCNKTFTQLGNLKSHQNRFHLSTLNGMTQRVASLSGDQFEALPAEEKALLNYFKDLYKNSNKGIRGRGKKNT